MNLDENGKEFIDNQYFTYEFQLPLIQDSILTELIKKLVCFLIFLMIIKNKLLCSFNQKTFERLESFQENDNKERFYFQNFIFQSIQFINEVSVYVTNQVKLYHKFFHLT